MSQSRNSRWGSPRRASWNLCTSCQVSPILYKLCLPNSRFSLTFRISLILVIGWLVIVILVGPDKEEVKLKIILLILKKGESKMDFKGSGHNWKIDNHPTTYQYFSRKRVFLSASLIQHFGFRWGIRNENGVIVSWIICAFSKVWHEQRVWMICEMKTANLLASLCAIWVSNPSIPSLSILIGCKWQVSQLKVLPLSIAANLVFCFPSNLWGRRASWSLQLQLEQWQQIIDKAVLFPLLFLPVILFASFQSVVSSSPASLESKERERAFLATATILPPFHFPSIYWSALPVLWRSSLSKNLGYPTWNTGCHLWW